MAMMVYDSEWKTHGDILAFCQDFCGISGSNLTAYVTKAGEVQGQERHKTKKQGRGRTNGQETTERTEGHAASTPPPPSSTNFTLNGKAGLAEFQARQLGHQSSDEPTRQGIPSSREMMAAWQVLPPLLVTTAPADLRIGSQSLPETDATQ